MVRGKQGLVAPRTHSQRKLGPQVPTRRIHQQLSRIVYSKATPSALSFSNRFPRRPGVCQPELGAAVRLRPLPLVQALQARIDSSKCSLELARDFHGGLSRVQHLNELFSSRSVQRGAEGRGPVIVRPPVRPLSWAFAESTAGPEIQRRLAPGEPNMLAFD
jgi:hypothetical protein